MSQSVGACDVRRTSKEGERGMIDCTMTCLSVLARGEIPNSNRVVHRARGKERMSVRAVVAWGEVSKRA
jgi:hypothetical protein